MNGKLKVLDINTIKQEDLPVVLSSQFDKLTVLETNVQKAVKSAVKAKEKAQDAQVKMGIFNYSKKEAINLLQSASEGLAEGLMTAAEAQKVSFEYQTKLTEITKFLFGLGVSNIAMNRSVVRELELKLKGASEEEISDLAKQELRNVILQLKAQEDIMIKQEELKGKVKNHHYQLESINTQLDNIEKLEEEQDTLIFSHSKKLLKYEEIFEEQNKKNALLKEEISDNTSKINELENSLKQQGQLFLKKNNAFDKKYSEITKELQEEVSDLTNTTNKDRETIKNDISSLMESMNREISLVKENLHKTETDLSNELNSIEEKLINTISELKEEVSKKDKEVNNKLTDLKNRIDNLETLTSKTGWKIGISIVAAGSLILNILQIFGII
ncbi:hypothetical protein [Clostridium isatidis]|uniref:Uncharacterized protein n=1 Tax=Clostridium isatidis TaxID=182773 RepID=A0A343JBF9_9CLOT|nr:hypothetical protein [Clostridium isatidis]ASW42867.1 hypothetical protein BEN51_05095 [Clostridium isatidis]